MHICLGVLVAAVFGLDVTGQPTLSPSAGRDECITATVRVAPQLHEAAIARAVEESAGELLDSSYAVVDRAGVGEARPSLGSLYTVPEPAMIVFLAIGGVSFLRRRR